MNLSKKSIQEITKRLQNIENRTQENMKLATKDLMNVVYETLVKVFEANNLSSHIGSIKKEPDVDGLGFRIWTNDWVVIFNEYGTGIKGQGTHPKPKKYQYNMQSEFKDENGRWVYYNSTTESFVTTNGMIAKHMFYDVEEALNKYAKEFYSTAINQSLSNKKYQSFRTSLR